MFAGRGGIGSSARATISALDAATGTHDGVVSMDAGDPAFTSHVEFRRVDAETRSTVVSPPRSCSVSGRCGPARDGDAIKVDEIGQDGQVLTRCSGSTGQKFYSSPLKAGFLDQNLPLCEPGGISYDPRTQNSTTVDRLFMLRETGSEIEILRSQQVRHEFNARHAVMPDCGVTMVSPQGRLEVRDQLAGALRFQPNMSVVAAGGLHSSMTSVDQAGQTLHSGGGGSTAEIRVLGPDLQLQWSIPAIAVLNQGGPVLAADGSMLVANTAAIRRCWTPPPCAPADLNCDGSVNAAGIAALRSAWG